MARIGYQFTRRQNLRWIIARWKPSRIDKGDFRELPRRQATAAGAEINLMTSSAPGRARPILDLKLPVLPGGIMTVTKSKHTPRIRLQINGRWIALPFAEDE